MRLFTALWPPPEAVAALLADVPDAAPSGWRRIDPSTWHVTLAFHGEADPDVLGPRLEREVRGLPVPRLRLAGAGAFDGVRWAGVEADAHGLDALVAAAGGDVARFVAHVTVLRGRTRPGPDAATDPATPWAAHRGPWWRPEEVLLVASEQGRAGVRYRVVHRAAPA
ncbi:MAG: 2,3-cyclic 3-phosphodiesterase [Pseudonocardiales bacterium]|nr:2,3-cyclic 3-phosphodiesterase [Pseudonocardiales bacterium]